MAQFQVPGALPAAVPLNTAMAQQGGGGELRYLNDQSQPLPVRFQQKDLYIEGTWLVTHQPLGELSNGQALVPWNQIALQAQQGYFEATALAGQALQWAATEKKPLPVIQRVALAGLGPGINWIAPYCTRGWISSLMPTVSCRGTVTWRGQSVIIGQNLHKGSNFGSSWLQGVNDEDVKPGNLPGDWKAVVKAHMPDGTGRDDFKAEITFSDHLESLGAKPIDQADEDIRMNRWRVLYLKYGEDITNAPGGRDALEKLRSNLPTPGTKYELN